MTTYRSLGKVDQERADRWTEAAKAKERPFTWWAGHALDVAAEHQLCKTYRAGYWQSSDRQSEIVLTDRQHSALGDADLISLATSYATRTGVDVSGGRIIAGDWTES